jgi:hypothetical protein
MAFGNAKSSAPMETAWPNKKGGFLAAIRGQHDLVAAKDGKQVSAINKHQNMTHWFMH